MRANPQLKVGSATLKRKTRTFTVAGTIAGTASGKVRVDAHLPVGKATRKKTLTLTVKQRQVQRQRQALGRRRAQGVEAGRERELRRRQPLHRGDEQGTDHDPPLMS